MRNLFDNPMLLIVLLLIIVLVFGAKRLPEAARSVGRSMRIFKSEVKEMRDDDASPSAAPQVERVIDDRSALAAAEIHAEDPARTSTHTTVDDLPPARLRH